MNQDKNKLSLNFTYLTYFGFTYFTQNNVWVTLTIDQKGTFSDVVFI